MKDIKLNETPVRTSVNFGINNILIKDINIPEKFNKFNNLEVENNSKNIKVIQNSDFNDTKFVYGIGDEIENLDKNSKTEIILEETNKKQKVKLDFKLEYENLCDCIKINAKENSSGVVILKYDSLNKEQHFVNTKIKVEAKENSNIKLVVLNMLNDSSNNFLAIESDISKEATLNIIIVDFGGKTSVSNCYSNLLEKSCVNTIDTIYIGEKERLIDINYIAHLRGEKTDVNIEVQGALKDNARKNFKGTIDFKTGSKKAKGNENEFCMLLSLNAKSKALPMLLCAEEDIEGNHSTSSGKVNKSELFYLMSRGISENEAMKLIVRAKFAPIIKKIEDEYIKKEIMDEIDRKLD